MKFERRYSFENARKGPAFRDIPAGDEISHRTRSDNEIVKELRDRSLLRVCPLRSPLWLARG